MNSGRHARPTALALLLLLATMMLAACGGSSRLPLRARACQLENQLLRRPFRISVILVSCGRTRISWLVCGRTGWTIRRWDREMAVPRPSGGSNLKSLSYQKAAIRCYPALGAALRILPKALQRYVRPHARRDVEDIIATSRAGVVPYRVPSGSMAPTLEVGDRAYYRALSRAPSIGEIVIFHPPAGAVQEECGPKPPVLPVGGAACEEPVSEAANIRFIKRVVAGPGDEIYIKEGHVYRKAEGKGAFVREQDSYIRECGSSPECSFPTPIKIPRGHWFLMGDNRMTVASGGRYRPAGSSARSVGAQRSTQLAQAHRTWRRYLLVGLPMALAGGGRGYEPVDIEAGVEESA